MPDKFFLSATGTDLSRGATGARVLWSGHCAVAEYAFEEPNSLPRWTLPEESEVLVLEDRVVYRDIATGATGELRWTWPQHLRVQPGSRDSGRSATTTQVQLVCAAPGGTFPALVFAGGELNTVRDADRLANVLRQTIARFRIEHAADLGVSPPHVRMLSRLVIGPEFSNYQGGEGQTVSLLGALSVEPPAAPRRSPVYGAPAEPLYGDSFLDAHFTAPDPGPAAHDPPPYGPPPTGPAYGPPTARSAPAHGPVPARPAPSHGPAPTGPAPHGPTPHGPAPHGPAPARPASAHGPTLASAAPYGPARPASTHGPAPTSPAPYGPAPAGPAPYGPRSGSPAPTTGAPPGSPASGYVSAHAAPPVEQGDGGAGTSAYVPPGYAVPQYPYPASAYEQTPAPLSPFIGPTPAEPPTRPSSAHSAATHLTSPAARPSSSRQSAAAAQPPPARQQPAPAQPSPTRPQPVQASPARPQPAPTHPLPGRHQPALTQPPPARHQPAPTQPPPAGRLPAPTRPALGSARPAPAQLSDRRPQPPPAQPADRRPQSAPAQPSPAGPAIDPQSGPNGRGIASHAEFGTTTPDAPRPGFDPRGRARPADEASLRGTPDLESRAADLAARVANLVSAEAGLESDETRDANLSTYLGTPAVAPTSPPSPDRAEQIRRTAARLGNSARARSRPISQRRSPEDDTTAPTSGTHNA